MTADAAEAPVTASRSGKSQAAFRTISEVADELDVAQHVLRFWESKFPQVRPLKRGGGRRYYRPEDIELLRDIRTLLYDEGYTIKGAQKLLRQRRARTPAGPVTKQSATAAPVDEPPDSRTADALPPPAATADDPRQHLLDASMPVPPAVSAAAMEPPLPAEPDTESDAPTAAPSHTETTAAEDLERLRQVRDELATLRRDLAALLTAEGN